MQCTPRQQLWSDVVAWGAASVAVTSTCKSRFPPHRDSLVSSSSPTLLRIPGIPTLKQLQLLLMAGKTGLDPGGGGMTQCGPRSSNPKSIRGGVTGVGASPLSEKLKISPTPPSIHELQNITRNSTFLVSSCYAHLGRLKVKTMYPNQHGVSYLGHQQKRTENVEYCYHFF